MDNLILLIILTIALGLLIKVCRLIREVILTVIYLLGLIVAIRFAVKWVVVPIINCLVWIGKTTWKAFRQLCRTIDRHYRYRNCPPALPLDRH